MNFFKSLAIDLSHALAWYLLILAVILFAGGEELSYIYTQF